MAAMTAEVEKDDVPLASLSLKYIVLLLRMITSGRERFLSPINGFVPFTQQMLELRYIERHPNSTIDNYICVDILNFVNQIIVSATNKKIAAIGQETIAVISFAVIDDQVFNQPF